MSIKKRIEYTVQLPEKIHKLLNAQGELVPMDEQMLRDLYRELVAFCQALENELGGVQLAMQRSQRHRLNQAEMANWINQVHLKLKGHVCFSLKDVVQEIKVSPGLASCILGTMLEKKMLIRNKLGTAWNYEWAPDKVAVG